MFDLLDISLADCKRHFTNSVGQSTKEAKNAAAEPAKAFSNVLRLFISFLDLKLQIPFWHRPYDMKRTAFSMQKKVYKD